MTANKLFLQAARGERTERTPIWLNRQAGRYMPEYHALKGDTPSLDFFTNPDMAAQATLDAQRILGVDAAILFADLLPILVPMGLDLEYVPGRGPVFANPVRSAADVTALQVQSAAEATPYIAQTVKNVLSGLPSDIALIGFGASPFTLASYAIEGQGSRNYVFVKKMMYEAPELWHQLMEKLTTQLISYLCFQMDAGAEAIQLFDTWVGSLSIQDFQTYVRVHTTRLIKALKDYRPDLPVIYFGTGNAHLLPEIAAIGPDVLALDWRTPMAETRAALQLKSVQGNLDPIVLCADKATIKTQAEYTLAQAGTSGGHIFNLGHGIIPETPVDNVKYLVELVQAHRVNV
ncbi:MAG: uroporphyrinogen decarboxylase [Pseudomonadales bacterium]